MKNVLFISCYPASYAGNFIPSLCALERVIVERGGKVQYVFPIEVEQYEWSHSLKNVQFTDWSKKNLKSIIKSAKRNMGIDLIHVHFMNWRQAASVKAASQNVPIVWHFHNHLEIKDNEAGYKKFIRKSLLKHIYAKDVKIGVSKSVSSSVRDIVGSQNLFTITNAIETSRMENYSQDTVIPKNENIRCLIMGNHCDRKGVDIALNAIDRLNKNGKEIELYIPVSSDEAIKEYIKRKMGQCEFVHIIPARNDIASYYRAVDIFLSPSREEGFTYSVIEAAYCGCQVVASAIPGQDEIRIPHIYWISDPNVKAFEKIVVDLMEKIEHCIEDRSKGVYLQNVQEDVTYIKKEFSLQKWADEVIDTYFVK